MSKAFQPGGPRPSQQAEIRPKVLFFDIFVATLKAQEPHPSGSSQDLGPEIYKKAQSRLARFAFGSVTRAALRCLPQSLHQFRRPWARQASLSLIFLLRTKFPTLQHQTSSFKARTSSPRTQLQGDATVWELQLCLVQVAHCALAWRSHPTCHPTPGCSWSLPELRDLLRRSTGSLATLPVPRLRGLGTRNKSWRTSTSQLRNYGGNYSYRRYHP